MQVGVRLTVRRFHFKPRHARDARSLNQSVSPRRRRWRRQAGDDPSTDVSDTVSDTFSETVSDTISETDRPAAS
jgi:hypothetical protein